MMTTDCRVALCLFQGVQDLFQAARYHEVAKLNGFMETLLQQKLQINPTHMTLTFRC